VKDCIVDTTEEHQSEADEDEKEEDGESDSEDDDVVMEDSDGGTSTPAPDANISTPVHTSLNESAAPCSCSHTCLESTPSSSPLTKMGWYANVPTTLILSST
jgi:hypothetical protein